VERGSDKHSPRIDEQLQHDTRSIVQGAPVEARVEEHREQEGAGEGDPEQSYDGWIDDRSELARHLEPSSFPAGRDGLLAGAGEQHAPDWVVAALRSLPADRTFHTTEEVWEALGGQRERRP